MGRAFEFRKARKMKRWSAMSKAFTKIGKEISMSVKEGGADRETNSRLRQVIQNAKDINMPKENIERAIKKASGADAINYTEISFEGYGPEGVAIFLDCTTDNNNRTVANIRSYFNKYEGSLGKNGSLEFMFDRKGVFEINLQDVNIDMEILEMELIDSGLEELVKNENCITIYCEFSDFKKMQESIENLNINIQSSELERIPNSTTKVSEENGKLVLKLLAKLEDDDDVQQVFHNMKLTKEILTLIDQS